MTDQEAVIREALGHVEYPAEEFLVPAMEALAALVAERDEAQSRERHSNRRTHELAAHVRQAVAERDKLREALIAMRNLASVSTEGDPWYAERDGIDAEAVFEQARAALAVSA